MRQWMLGFGMGLLVLGCGLLFLQGFGALSGETLPTADREVIYQVSTIDALMEGEYDGLVPLRELSGHGDFGIGTFEALDGEMVVFNGTCYQVKGDGRAYVADPSVGIPFAAVTFFDTDIEIPVAGGSNFSEFTAALDRSLPSKSAFYAIRMDGVFPSMTVRSVDAQQEPYPRLAEALEFQKVYEHSNISGSLVGLYAPPNVGGLNVPGYHLHFISEDRSTGGHVLAFVAPEGAAELDTTAELHVIFKEDAKVADQSTNLTDELERAEKQR